MSTIDPGIEETINEKADPSLDDKDGAKDDAAIEEAPSNEEAANQAQRSMEQDEREDFEFKNRWWFASVAAPLLAGTFGPMATAFNILALAYHWRESIPTGVPPAQGEKLGHTIADLPWVTACYPPPISPSSIVSCTDSSSRLSTPSPSCVPWSATAPSCSTWRAG